jgi:hypothetical protein
MDLQADNAMIGLTNKRGLFILQNPLYASGAYLIALTRSTALCGIPLTSGTSTPLLPKQLLLECKKEYYGGSANATM